jgi:hypothetical protein
MLHVFIPNLALISLNWEMGTPTQKKKKNVKVGKSLSLSIKTKE